jgi:hypothetical protein
MCVGFQPLAQSAIASHDHRTGVRSDTLLADALKIAAFTRPL